MQTNAQAGLSNLQIMTIFAVAIVAIGAISLYSSDDKMSETAEITETRSDSAVEQSPIDKMDDMSDEAMVDSDMETASESDEMDESMEETDNMMGTADTVDAEVSVEAEATVAPVAEPVVVSTPGTFSDYSADKLALAENGTVVLFFHASWCPSCRALENDLNASLRDIPTDTHILKLDYDSETELKRKYGVVRQHTLVVVDSNGNEVKKLTGLTNTLEQVVNQL